MKREGFTLPLLIGGATTSKAHTAVKIAPAYPPGVVHVLDASRAVGVVGQLKNPAERAEFLEANRARAGEGARASPVGGGRTAAARRSKRRAGAAPRSTGRPTSRRGRRSLGIRVVRRLAARGARPPHRLVALLPHLGAEGDLSADLREPDLGIEGARALRRRAEAPRPDRGRAAAHRAGGDGLLPGQCGGRRHRRLRRRGAARHPRDLPDAAPAGGQAAGPARAGAVRLRGARARAASTISWAPSPSPRASGSTRWSPSSSATTTTTTRSWPRRSPIGWPRRWRRRCTSARARNGDTGATSGSRPRT